ncbi:2,3-bisphosphoglycerate-dependent phosphoglycerate mutase [Simkania sp.]|uniref:2,3-bisphosphoglycerate-dependent phosphoglycerate mutase n=1 Tax=Simkania sp. TaxID=34094 RepID=UPI003B52E062
MKECPKIILLRHGQSVWNKRNLFTGWVDVPLSQAGIEEALNAGKRFSAIPIDIIFMSSLIRAQLTAMLAMSVHSEGKVPVVLHPDEKKQETWAKNYNPKASEMTVPVVTAWEINERMYGELQGLDKDETRQKYGAEQVKIWRRSFDTPPPNGESLKMTAERSIPYFENEIVPHLQEGKNILVSAHGNSLRSIVMFLDKLSEKEVLELEIPTGDPICYSYDNGVWQREEIDQVQQVYLKGA